MPSYNEADLRAYARQMAAKYGIDPNTFERQIDQESGFQPGVTSPSGAQGIAQFMPATAASVGLSNPMDPYAALEASARLMAQYQRQFGSMDAALIAYNAGPGSIGEPLSQETQTYLSNITGGGGVTSNNATDYSDPQQRQKVLSGVVDALKASQPKKEDYTEPAYTDKFGNHPEVFHGDLFSQAMSDWGSQMSDALKQFQDASSEAAGVFQLGDGTIITQAQMDQLDPNTRAQVQAQIQNQNTDRLNSFNTLMNNLGLTEFTTTQNSAVTENQRTSNDFQNQLEHYREQLGLDQANQDTVVKQINRQLQGMDVSNSRASTTLDALLKAAPWGTTGGKTSFSPADLGGAIAKIAQFGGIGANQPLLNFTGTQNIDPNAMFQAYDQQLGVQGQLPQVPNLTTTPGMIPTPPASIPIQQGAPSFTPYIPPTPVPLPQASPPSGNALSPAANKLLHGIFSSLRGQ